MISNPLDITVKLSESLQKGNQLERIVYLFQKGYQLIPCFGAEVEFYLSDNLRISQLEDRLELKVKAEKGKRQFEIDLPPSTNLIKYASQINNTIMLIQEIAKTSGGGAVFKAKPYPHDYGNSLHLHLSFIPSVLSSPVTSNPATDWDLNLPENAARSLCYFMLDTFLVFLPDAEDYARLDNKFMAPTCVSYGNNNRTVAVRIPDQLPRRLEHRVASALADPYLVMFTILKSVFLGLQNPEQIPLIPKIYGNAFEDQYNLPPLPKTIDEALALFQPSFYDC